MKRVFLAVLLSVLAFTGCRREEAGGGVGGGGGGFGGGLGGSPIVTATAVNSGADLRLSWKHVEGAEGYRVYCDGNKIWEGTGITYTITGTTNVCKTVEVSAFAGNDERKYTLDLAPMYGIIIGLVSHDNPSGSSWVKLDFTNGSISVVRHSSVDPYAPNTGWFLFYNNYGTPEFRDASATSVGTARMEFAFTAPNSSGNLAPDAGSYSTVRETYANAYHFFWADNTSMGYGSMDSNDYFGVISVTSLTGYGPFTADLVIYIQTKVPGLRWVKF